MTKLTIFVHVIGVLAILGAVVGTVVTYH